MSHCSSFASSSFAFGRAVIFCAALAGFAALGAGRVSGEAPPDTPKPPVVKPGDAPGKPPADAVVLFDGKNLDQWTHGEGMAPKWEVLGDGAFRIKPDGIHGLFTKESFGDIQLHIEFNVPFEPNNHGQDRGNSGVYLQGTYEVQVLDSYNEDTYVDGQCGGIYGFYPPMVNACRPPGEWQTYDIVFRGPRLNEKGEPTALARLTVVHNGVLIQDNVEVPANTTAAPIKTRSVEGPIFLQDHGHPVMYRNIWLRKLPPIQKSLHQK